MSVLFWRGELRRSPRWFGNLKNGWLGGWKKNQKLSIEVSLGAEKCEFGFGLVYFEALRPPPADSYQWRVHPQAVARLRGAAVTGTERCPHLERESGEEQTTGDICVDKGKGVMTGVRVLQHCENQRNSFNMSLRNQGKWIFEIGISRTKEMMHVDLRSWTKWEEENVSGKKRAWSQVTREWGSGSCGRRAPGWCASREGRRPRGGQRALRSTEVACSASEGKWLLTPSLEERVWNVGNSEVRRKIATSLIHSKYIIE